MAQSLEETARAGPVMRIHLEPGVNKWADQPSPHGPLMIGRVASAEVAIVGRFIVRMSRGQRAQSDRGEQALLDDFQDWLPARLLKNRVAQCDGQELIRTAGRIIALLTVHDIIQVAARPIPETGIERVPCPLRVRHERVCRLITLFGVCPLGEQTQRVVPERIDLHRLAAPWRHHPITDFRIHPGELIIDSRPG